MRLRMAPRVKRMLEKISGHLNNKIQQYWFHACGKRVALTHDAKVEFRGTLCPFPQSLCQSRTVLKIYLKTNKVLQNSLQIKKKN